MSRVCLTVQYDGSEYHGWQFQKSMPHLQTVQATLEAALSKIADHEVSVVCAGRTDRGVHALGQVVHFDTTAQRDLTAWVLGANSHLPDSVVVRTSQLVADDFHARFSALTRSYRYKIYNSKLPDVFANRLATWVKTKLDVPAMQIAAKYLIGEHDFSAFRASGCQAKTAVRTLELLDITRNKHWIDVDLRANAFLYHMVRNIMGSLILVGKGFRPPEWVQDILLQKDRKLAADTASARGLYLTAVQYPDLIANNET